MTETINGIGTVLFGSRQLTYDEYLEHKDQLPYDYDEVIYLIATEGSTFFWIPVVPLNTIIYSEIKSVQVDKDTREEVIDSVIYHEELANGSQYSHKLKKGVHGTNKYYIFSTYYVNWNHVRSSLGFYFSPIMLPILIIYQILTIIYIPLRFIWKRLRG